MAGRPRMDEQQERELARGLRQGEVVAWRLMTPSPRRCWRTVARLMGPGSADVADVVQETFLAAARSARTYDPDRGTLWLWLWGIARRHVAVHYRKENRHDLAARNGLLLHCLHGEEPTPPELLATAELTALVRSTLTELPIEYEALLTARYLERHQRGGHRRPGTQHCRGRASKLARAGRPSGNSCCAIPSSTTPGDPHEPDRQLP